MEILLISLVIHFPFFVLEGGAIQPKCRVATTWGILPQNLQGQSWGLFFYSAICVWFLQGPLSFAWDMWLTLCEDFSYKRKDWEHIWPVLESASIVGAYKNIITICLSSHILLVVLA